MPATEPSADGNASEPTRTFVAGGDTALGEPADPVIAAPYPATEAGSSGVPHPPTKADSSGARHVPARALRPRMWSGTARGSQPRPPRIAPS